MSDTMTCPTWRGEHWTTRVSRVRGLLYERVEQHGRCGGHDDGSMACTGTLGICIRKDGSGDVWGNFLASVASPRGVTDRGCVDLAAMWLEISYKEAGLAPRGFVEALFSGEDVARAAARYMRHYDRIDGGNLTIDVYDTLLGLGNRHYGLLDLCRDPGKPNDLSGAKAIVVAGLEAVCGLVARYEEHTLRALETFVGQEAAQGRAVSVEDITRRYEKVERCVRTLSVAV